MCFFKKKKKRQQEEAARQEALKKEQAEKVLNAKKAEAEKKIADQKAIEKAEAEKKLAEQKAIEKANAEKKLAEQKAIEEADAEQKAIKNAAADKKVVEAKDSATKTVDTADATDTTAKASKKAPAKKAAPKAEKAVAKQEETAEEKAEKSGKIEIFKDKEERFRFRIKAANGQTIARSESYSTKAGCKKGFSSIQNYEEIDIVDITDDNTSYVPKIGAPVFEVYVDNGGLFRFRYRSGNAIAVLFCTQGYKSKASCIKSVNSVIKNSCNFAINDITKEKVIDD